MFEKGEGLKAFYKQARHEKNKKKHIIFGNAQVRHEDSYSLHSHTVQQSNGQEAYYGRPVILADRDMVESNSDEILRDAQTEDVAFLVVGDPFG